MSVSVDNFYWVLYENLLKPVGIDCRFEYPFGSGHIVRWPFHHLQSFNQPYGEKRDNPKDFNGAFLHFDQEPIYQKDIQFISHGTAGNFMKNIRLFANSESSELKKQVCKKFQLQDWYYFYHGFAALDWYRDAEHVSTDYSITDSFSSFNHIIQNKRSYRMSLTARLASKGILDAGTVSFHGDWQHCVNEINDTNTEISPQSQQLIQDWLINKKIQPMIVDSEQVDGNYSAKFGGNIYRMRQRSFLHLVNETIFYDRKLHLTEKAFHPIVHLRPFMLVAAPGNLAYLKSYGFQTFDRWLDESYDAIEDDDRRLDHIAAETDRIAKKSIGELKEMLEEMRPVLEFNKQHFFGKFRELIADELVQNFETCIRIWNNGRVDDKSIYMPDYDQLCRARKLLSR